MSKKWKKILKGVGMLAGGIVLAPTIGALAIKAASSVPLLGKIGMTVASFTGLLPTPAISAEQAAQAGTGGFFPVTGQDGQPTDATGATDTARVTLWQYLTKRY